MGAVTICSDFEAQENKVCHYVHCFTIYFPWSNGTRAMNFVFWMLSFKPIFPLSIFTFIKRLLNSSSLAAIRVLSSAYLRLLTFLPTILIPACASSSPAFHMMYSVHRDFLVAQMAKRLPAVQIWIRSLAWEDPLDIEMATHSSTLSWKFPWTEEPGRLQSMGSQRVEHDWVTFIFTRAL